MKPALVLSLCLYSDSKTRFSGKHCRAQLKSFDTQLTAFPDSKTRSINWQFPLPQPHPANRLIRMQVRDIDKNNIFFIRYYLSKVTAYNRALI